MTGRGPAKRVFVAVAVKSLVGFPSDHRAVENTRADADADWDGACSWITNDQGQTPAMQQAEGLQRESDVRVLSKENRRVSAILMRSETYAKKTQQTADSGQQVVRCVVVVIVVVVQGDESSRVDMVNSSSCSSTLRSLLARSLVRVVATHLSRR
jgi:hypothetical protein